jgi:hypothetical protein
MKKEISQRDVHLDYLKKIIREINWLRKDNPYRELLAPKVKSVWTSENSYPNHRCQSFCFRFSNTWKPERGDVYVIRERWESEYGHSPWDFYRTPDLDSIIEIEFEMLNAETLLSAIDELTVVEVLNW